MKKSKQPETVKTEEPGLGQTVYDLLMKMSPDQRMAIFSRFCPVCGSDDPLCACWNQGLKE